MSAETPHRNLLVFHLIVLNASVVAVLAWAYAKGLLQWLFSFETTGIGYGLTAITVVAIAGIFRSALKVGAAFNRVKTGTPVDTRRMLIKIGYIGAIAKYVMYVGLWANSLGILIAFTVLILTSTDTILTSVAGMIGGLKIAFANTLISIPLFLLVFENLRVLVGAIRLLAIESEDLKVKLNG